MGSLLCKNTLTYASRILRDSMELKILSYIHCDVLASYWFANSVASQIAKHTWQQEPFSSNLGVHLVLGLECQIMFPLQVNHSQTGAGLTPPPLKGLGAVVLSTFDCKVVFDVYKTCAAL